MLEVIILERLRTEGVPGDRTVQLAHFYSESRNMLIVKIWVEKKMQ